MRVHKSPFQSSPWLLVYWLLKMLCLFKTTWHIQDRSFLCLKPILKINREYKETAKRGMKSCRKPTQTDTRRDVTAHGHSSWCHICNMKIVPQQSPLSPSQGPWEKLTCLHTLAPPVQPSQTSPSRESIAFEKHRLPDRNACKHKNTKCIGNLAALLCY